MSVTVPCSLPSHAGAPARLFCLDDNSLVCEQCVVECGSHTGHSVLPLAHVSDAVRSRLSVTSAVCADGAAACLSSADKVKGMIDSFDAHAAAEVREFKCGVQAIVARVLALQDQVSRALHTPLILRVCAYLTLRASVTSHVCLA